MRFQRTWTLCLMLLFLVSAGGCGDASRFDESQLHVGMDRSSIIAHFGAPDKKRIHGYAERLIYRDGEHYQYLLMLLDGKLDSWHHDRVYKDDKFSISRD